MSTLQLSQITQLLIFFFRRGTVLYMSSEYTRDRDISVAIFAFFAYALGMISEECLQLPLPVPLAHHLRRRTVVTAGFDSTSVFPDPSMIWGRGIDIFLPELYQVRYENFSWRVKHRPPDVRSHLSGRKHDLLGESPVAHSSLAVPILGSFFHFGVQVVYGLGVPQSYQ